MPAWPDTPRGSTATYRRRGTGRGGGAPGGADAAAVRWGGRADEDPRAVFWGGCAERMHEKSQCLFYCQRVDCDSE